MLRKLVAAGRLKRIAAFSRHPAEFVFRVVAAEHNMPPLATPEVDREICGATINLCGEAGTRCKLGRVFVRWEERLLRQLDRVILVVYNCKSHIDDPPLVPLNQNPKRLRIALPGPFYELGFVAVLPAC